MNNSADPKDFFVRQAIAHAFTLSLPDSIVYLRGLCELGGDIQAINQIREVLAHMSHSEEMMTLITSGQRELKFTA